MRKINFDPVAHVYTDENGDVVKSVTQILKAVGFGPQGDYKSEAMVNAAERGNIVHDFLNSHVLFGETADDEVGHEHRKYYSAFKKFLSENDVKFECGEYAVFNTINGVDIAGTVDVKCVINGKRAIIDFKTTKTIEKYHAFQLALYRGLDEEKTDAGYILQLMANGQYVLMEDEVICPGCNAATTSILEAYKKGEKFSDVAEMDESADVLKWYDLKQEIEVKEKQKKDIETKLKRCVKGSAAGNKYLTITYTRPTISIDFDEEKFLMALDDETVFTGAEVKELMEICKSVKIGKPTYKIAAAKTKAE